MGDPEDEDTNMGALISLEHLNKVKGFISIARDIKATIHCGDGVDPLDLPENKSKVRLLTFSEDALFIRHKCLIPALNK